MSQTTQRSTALSTHPVPRSVTEWVRQTKRQPTINDMVEDLHMKVLEDDQYVHLLDAIYNEQAVEGSMVADDLMAAIRLRDEAFKQGSRLADQKLSVIVKALRVVLKRYGMGRTQRRMAFYGGSPNGEATVTTPASDGDDDI